jgi:hypothetical protein
MDLWRYSRRVAGQSPAKEQKMLEFKGPAQKPTLSRKLDWLAEFDFLRALVDFFAAAWSTEQMVLRPIPVRVRNRRR